jgi:RNA polymerase sigma-70 factor
MAHEALLRRGFDEGRAAHPGPGPTFEAYARHVLDRTRRRLSGDGGDPPGDEVAEALSRAALADLYLAAACEENLPGAWEAFAGFARTTVLALALRAGASRAEAEELAQSIPGELYAAPPGGAARTRLGTYDGSGSLAGWLAVIVRRRVADRRRGPAAAMVEIPAVPETRERDPAVLAEDAETARVFGEALRGAWAELTDRERFVLRLRFRDGVAQREIARLLGVGEPRVSRSIHVAVGKIRAAVLRRVGPDAPSAPLERAVSDFMGSLGPGPDPPSRG